ncbi:D-Ala-D-Ala carboxypeptidase family metallohydrolase [Ruminococcus sp.]
MSEFRCKCGKEHETLNSPELIEKLEKLFTALNCSKIIVTSGYRCEQHDKNVGGTVSNMSGTIYKQSRFYYSIFDDKLH